MDERIQDSYPQQLTSAFSTSIRQYNISQASSSRNQCQQCLCDLRMGTIHTLTECILQENGYQKFIFKFIFFLVLKRWLIFQVLVLSDLLEIFFSLSRFTPNFYLLHSLISLPIFLLAFPLTFWYMYTRGFNQFWPNVFVSYFYELLFNLFQNSLHPKYKGTVLYHPALIPFWASSHSV